MSIECFSLRRRGGQIHSAPFGERLRALRTERGLSQEKLCQMIKVNRNFVGSVERGKQNICIDNVLQLARALKVNPRDFFDLYKK
jgi:transcriptional regulator with XRE-family HTH domain